jgi:hypothetical protein
VIGPRDIGKRVSTPADVDGIAREIRRNLDEIEVVAVELDGHTYGPGRPFHEFPIGTVCVVGPSESADLGPSWYPVNATEDTPDTEELPTLIHPDTPSRQYGDDWDDEFSAAYLRRALRREHDES